MSRRNLFVSAVFSLWGLSSVVAQTQDSSDIRKISGTEVRSRRPGSNTIVTDASKLVRIMPSANRSVEALIKTYPGVSSNNELSSQYSVRGGNYDENLIYVNDIEVFRPLLIRSGEQEGLSFINPDLVSTVQFSSGGFDAKYGDKMSSVLDIRYKRPTAFAGSVSLDLLGVSAHLEGASKNQKLKGLIGVRQKSNQYLLDALPTEGDYRPSFTDVQTFLSYTLNDRWELDFLGNVALNKYLLIPSSRRTNFGTRDNPLGLYIQFQGQEIDRFNSIFGTLSATYKPTVNEQHRLSITGYQSVEREFFDIAGAYHLSETNNDMGSDEFGEEREIIGVGEYLNHARNELNAVIYNLNYFGRYLTSKMYWLWGAKYQREDILDYLNEWKMVDSLGYTLPYSSGIPGAMNPAQPPVLQNTYNSEQHLISNRFQAFIQNNMELSPELALTAGVRFAYWDWNNEFLASPRASLVYAPEHLPKWSFKFATGLYYQSPFYREFRDLKGELNTNIKSQRSIHFVGSAEYFLSIWKQPFKLTTDVYYKALSNLIPYEVDNVRVRYLAENMGKGYALGMDVRLAGEVVKGVESWASLSIMSTKERIDGISVAVPRPTDQRINFNLFFQDHLTSNERVKAHLNLVFGTGLPYGSPDALNNIQTFKYRDDFRLPAYKRVDLGFSYQLKKLKFGQIWISGEIFNIFDMKNTISYLWISDYNNTQYAVGNHLTSRRLNIKISIEF